MYSYNYKELYISVIHNIIMIFFRHISNVTRSEIHMIIMYNYNFYIYE